MKRALNLANLTTARHEHRPTVIQSVEGAHFLNGKLERLEVAYQRGLRHLTLLHDSDAAVPLGDVYTNPSQWNGLTDFGAEVLRACNRMGIVTDLAHASNDTLNAALKIAQQPVIISHTGLNTQIGTSDFQNNMMMPRLISAEQAKIVAQAGGVIGIWTHLADSPLAYAQHIRAMVDVVGIDHVCIGTDTKLTPAYRKPETAAAGKQAMKETGNAGAMQTDKPKQMEHKPRPGERTNEAWTGMTSGFYYAVVEALVQTGFNEAEIGKIGSGNFCRVFAAATR